MSIVASQVILHPTVSNSLKVLATTLGRDKVYRAVQYFARFFAWYLLSRGYKLEASRWNALKGHLATGRKLLRLGKPVEHLQAALRASQGTGEIKEQLLTIARQLGYFGYLTYDAIVWANSIRFLMLKPETAQKVNKTANRFWLAGILFSITHAVFKAGRLTQEANELRSMNEKNIGGENARLSQLRALESARADTRQQFVIDILDLWIPAANVGLVNFNDGILGIFGVITSVLALRSQWLSVTGAKRA
ncbi:peroxisomal biogenesis factor 11 [Stereum hirsutum FP-91666 SS1]|uniref:peroxisomal biogenesis factor 11 n=1 Tax=Stereum hirsutum (strain FP-91666) TaxID=721885 RepID=UPI000440C035|nr:peroxisomal biogenesis factor 11 [Stereum hirsutum FP-91666 SS1]EIM92657.1 peroxisomal biogenesis factor 11 [Stereum hirsutum FP-91666 SS1]